MLGLTGKRVLLTVHIIVNSIWIGGVALILFLNEWKSSLQAGTGVEFIDEMIFRIHDGVVMNIGFVVIITSFLFSLFTKWGFFDFYWVSLKWLNLVTLFVVITFFLAPAVNGMAALSNIEGLSVAENPEYLEYKRMTTLLSVSLLFLLCLVVTLSVFKPWGPRKKPFQTRRKVVLSVGIVAGVFAVGAGASQFVMLEHFRSTEIEKIDLSHLHDGTYRGSADLGIRYDVSVTIKEHQITAVEVHGEAPNHYAHLARAVTKRMITNQSVQVRAITGATTSSKGLLKATANALRPSTK